MTRREFEEECTSVNDLIDFAYEHDLYNVLEDIYYSDSYDEIIEQDVADWTGGWESLRDWLSDLPSGYEYYWRSEYDGTWEGIDYSHYDMIHGWIVEAYDFDEEEEEEEEDFEEEESYGEAEGSYDDFDFEFDVTSYCNSCQDTIKSLCDTSEFDTHLKSIVS